MFDRLLCWLEDLATRIDLLTFRINQKEKEIKNRHSK